VNGEQNGELCLHGDETAQERTARSEGEEEEEEEKKEKEKEEEEAVKKSRLGTCQKRHIHTWLVALLI